MRIKRPLGHQLAAIDAGLAGPGAAPSGAAASARRTGHDKDSLVYDLDWDEWRVVLTETDGPPPVPRAVILLARPTALLEIGVSNNEQSGALAA